MFLQLIKESKFKIPLPESVITLRSLQFSIPFRLESEEHLSKIISFNFREFLIPLIFSKYLHRSTFIQKIFFALTKPSRFFIGVSTAFTPCISTEFSSPFNELICVEEMSINFMFFNLVKGLILSKFFE